MSKSAHTPGRIYRWWIGALAYLSVTATGLQAQQAELPQLRAWHLLPEYYNAAALPDGSSASVLYGRAGRDLSHYLLQGSFPLSLGATSVRLGAGLEQAKGFLWEGNDLTGRAGITLLERASIRLHGGVEVNLLRRSFDGARALSEGITDSELPTTRTEGKAFDLGLGLALDAHRWELGLSAQHLLGAQVTLGERFVLTEPRTLHLLATYLIGQRQGWSLRPATHVVWVSQSGLRSEFALGLHYQDRYQLRASWERESAWSFAGAVKLGHFLLGYTWLRDRHSDAPRHEFVLSYRLPRTDRPTRPTKYTSLRLL